jgi:LysM repeat protein
MIDFETQKLKSDTLLLTPQIMRVASSSSSSASNSSSSVSSTNKDYHIVKKGDTLYSISRKYGVPLKRILQINHIKETSILSIGQKIKLK